mgnify:CR=1 FL=1
MIGRAAQARISRTRRSLRRAKERRIVDTTGLYCTPEHFRQAEELVRKSLSPEDQARLVRENIEKIEGIVR